MSFKALAQRDSKVWSEFTKTQQTSFYSLPPWNTLPYHVALFYYYQRGGMRYKLLRNNKPVPDSRFCFACCEDEYALYRFKDTGKSKNNVSDLQSSAIFAYNPQFECTGEFVVPYINPRPFVSHYDMHVHPDKVYQYADGMCGVHFLKQEMVGTDAKAADEFYTTMVGAAEDWRCGFYLGCPWLQEVEISTQ